MKTGLKRGISAMLAIFMLLAGLAICASADDSSDQTAEDQSVADFVILLDCSFSLGQNDPKYLSIEACKNFIDKLPAQDARVAVIAFGYRGGSNYSFAENIIGEPSQEEVWFHEIIPLGALDRADASMSSISKAEYKKIIEETVQQSRSITFSYTPLGHAVAAGVNLLETNNSADSNACMILVSDGVVSCRDRAMDEKILDPALQRANNHDWPIYCIGLNYSNSDLVEINSAQSLMDRITKNNGFHSVGKLNCETPRDVHVAFKKIFDDFYGRAAGEVIEAKLPGEYTFEIPELTSEASIDVFGDSITYVELVNLEEGSSRKIAKSISEDGIIASVEPGSYFSVKIICPKPGQWKVLMYGDADATVLVSNSTLQELGLSMATSSSADPQSLTKQDTITVDAFFSYQNYEIHNISFYGENEASLIVTSASGAAKEIPIEGNRDGYHYVLKMDDIPCGSFTVQVILRHMMFRNGLKRSSSESFCLNNIPSSVVKTGSIEMSGFLNTELEKIDLKEIFGNPDGDPVEYELICASNRTADFQYRVDSDYLVIKGCTIPGTYQMTVTARDPEMAEAVHYDDLILNISNRPPTSQKIRALELWTDKYLFQKKVVGGTQLDLNDYFSDPDGLKLAYTITDETSGIVNFEEENGILSINPLKEGHTTLTVTAKDYDGETMQKIKIVCISGQGAFWRDNWIFFLIALAILVFLIVVIIVIFKNKRVKGDWEITFDWNGEEDVIQNMNIAGFTAVGRKRSFLLRDLLNELVAYTSNPSYWGLKTSTAFGDTPAGSIRLEGVIRKQGCKVTSIPQDNNTRVSCNGIVATGKTLDVPGGRVVFSVMDENTGETMQVTMRLL